MKLQKQVGDLIRHFDGQVKLAAALGLGQSTVSGWVTGSHGMSTDTALLVEEITNGKFKAKDLSPKYAKRVDQKTITRQLNPDDRLERSASKRKG